MANRNLIVSFNSVADVDFKLRAVLTADQQKVIPETELKYRWLAADDTIKGRADNIISLPQIEGDSVEYELKVERGNDDWSPQNFYLEYGTDTPYLAEYVIAGGAASDSVKVYVDAKTSFLETDGDGTKALFDDGEYKTVAVDLADYFDKTSDNTDNILQGTTKLFVSTAEKSTWNSKQAALGFTPVDAANVINNLTTTASGKVLDARQGKTLKDLIDALTIPIFVDGEIPAGAIDGTNKTFTLAHTPTSGSQQVYINGLLQLPTAHYTISGAVITLSDAPLTDSNVYVIYRR